MAAVSPTELLYSYGSERSSLYGPSLRRSRRYRETVCTLVVTWNFQKKYPQVLGPGPKLVAEARKTPHKVLTLVRQVARRIPEDESDRCVSEGVDVLSRCKPPSSALPTKNLVSFLKAQSLALLPSDKETGFAVLPLGMFN